MASMMADLRLDMVLLLLGALALELMGIFLFLVRLEVHWRKNGGNGRAELASRSEGD